MYILKQEAIRKQEERQFQEKAKQQVGAVGKANLSDNHKVETGLPKDFHSTSGVKRCRGYSEGIEGCRECRAVTSRQYEC